MLALFQGPLKEVSFPGVSLEAFELIFRKVEEQAREVEKAQAALEAARSALQRVHQEVIQQAQRALCASAKLVRRVKTASKADQGPKDPMILPADLTASRRWSG